jgi:hypothetical protein
MASRVGSRPKRSNSSMRRRSPSRIVAIEARVSPWTVSGKREFCGSGCGEYEANAEAQPTLLDLGKPSPNAVFTAVIYGDNRAKFGTPETSLRGKRICVTGKIGEYHGKPEIVLTDPSQLTQ